MQLSMELNDSKLSFLDIFITKPGKKKLMNIYSKSVDSKRYVYDLLNQLKPCLKILFCIARRICMVVENSQEKLRSEKLKNKGNFLPFISTYNPNNPNVFTKVRGIYGNFQTLKTFGRLNTN